MKHAKILCTGEITKTKLYWFADIIQERKDRYEPGDFTKMDLYNWWKFPIEKMKYLAEQNNSFIVFAYITSAYTAFGENVEFEGKEVGLMVKNLSNIQTQVFKILLTVAQTNYPINKEDSEGTYKTILIPQ